MAKRKAVNKNRNGKKIAPKPKYSVNIKLYLVGIGPVCKKEKTERIDNMRKKIKKID